MDNKEVLEQVEKFFELAEHSIGKDYRRILYRR